MDGGTVTSRAISSMATSTAPTGPKPFQFNTVKPQVPFVRSVCAEQAQMTQCGLQSTASRNMIKFEIARLPTSEGDSPGWGSGGGIMVECPERQHPECSSNSVAECRQFLGISNYLSQCDTRPRPMPPCHRHRCQWTSLNTALQRCCRPTGYRSSTITMLLTDDNGLTV